MKLFNRPEVVHNWDEEEADLLKTAVKRVAKCSDEQMVMWADGAASDMMKAFEDYMLQREPMSLRELRMCVITLQAVVKELSLRHVLTQ